MMKTLGLHLYFFLISLLPLSLHAQVSDDFSDPDLSDNPSWQGDLQDFVVNTREELQLSASVAGESFIYTTSGFFDSTRWDIYFRLEFAPSNSNQLIIHLQLDDPNPTQANGYFLKIGKTGSEDALEFFRLDGGNEILLSSGTLGSLGSDPAICRLQVERDFVGNWTFFTDYAGGQNLIPDFSFADNTHRPSNGFFGIHCQYTDSRKEQFFFDDFSIQPILPDTQPPVLLEGTALDENTIELTFSENVDPASAEKSGNYLISDGIGNPGSVMVTPGNPSKILLSLSNTLVSPNTYTIETNNIADINGNISGSQSTTVEFVNVEVAEAYELIINEILADPSPPAGLPESEFIEMYNPTNKIFNLSDYQFQDAGSNPVFLPNLLIYPGEYVIICDNDTELQFSPFGKVAPVTNFPSLTNGGEKLQILNLFGDLIDQVEYQDDWFVDPNKRDGGWTLEKINPSLFCLGQENWSASENLTGGTPGRENSVYNPQFNVEGPRVLGVYPISTNQIRVSFNQGMDSGNADNSLLYEFSPALSINEALLSGDNYSEVLLTLTENLEPTIIYELTINPAIFNCTENTLSGNTTFKIGLPVPATTGDILINEILFNPVTGGDDFIEIANVSDKIIDLSTLSLGNIQPGDTDIKNIDKPFLIFPGDLVVISTSPGNITDTYQVPFPEKLLENPLPSFSDDFGNVTIGIRDIFGLQVLDEVDYSKDWHHPLLDNDDGVSLERISFIQASQDPNNWQSAASTVGFATPTGKNSQQTNTNVSVENDFQLQPKTFSPDQDGRDDFLSIFYNLEKDGFLCTIKVYDINGVEVVELLRNELLALEGVIKWEGITEDGTKAPVGIYILHFQLTHPDGETRQFQRTCVVATQLD